MLRIAELAEQGRIPVSTDRGGDDEGAVRIGMGQRAKLTAFTGGGAGCRMRCGTGALVERRSGWISWRTSIWP